jgi:hypothetical protein
MREPSLRTSRLAIAGGFAAAIATCAAGFVVGRITSPHSDEAVPAIAPSSAATIPVVPVKPEDIRPLGRSDILSLADRVADSLSSGEAPSLDLAKFVGRRFDLVMPFGCSGPGDADGGEGLRWNYDPQKQVLRLSVSMTGWKSQDWALPDTLTLNKVPVGFWIARPWSSAERCPTELGPPESPAEEISGPADETLAIGQLQSDAEAQRKDASMRSFKTVQRVAPDRFAAMKGFAVRLTGRLVASGNGTPIHCMPSMRVEQRPRCMVMGIFDEIRIEATGERDALATWSIARVPRHD